MKAVAFLPALVALSLSLASTRPARAEDGGVPRTTVIGSQLSLGGGAWFGVPSGSVDHELARVGWSALPPASPARLIRFGITFFDVSLDMHFGGTAATLTGPAGMGGTWDRTAIGVDLGTRVRLGWGLQLAPFVGLGTQATTLCFTGRPSASSSLASAPFAQVLSNPGRGACLGASAPVLDVGLSLPWTVPMRPLEQRELGLLLSIGPKLAYSVRASSGDAWSTAPDADHPLSLPGFHGPTAPLGGGYAGIEIQVGVGLVRPSR